MDKLFSDIDTLFQRLILGKNDLFDRMSLNDDKDYAMLRISKLLKANQESTNPQKLEFRLRLAAHLSPVDAIKYNDKSPYPRWELIKNFLVNELGKDGDLIEKLARDVAIILDSWDSSRKSVTSHLSNLLAKQGNTCAHCHVYFSTTTRSSIDHYKPYHLSFKELMKPEVDHIEPVSCLGDNSENNLQVLCRMCNAGKGDGLGFDVRRELDHAANDIASIKQIHRYRMLYLIIGRDKKCMTCGSETEELTIKKNIDNGGYLRSNLQSICYRCKS